MTGIINNVQERFKTSSNAVALATFKVFTGFMLGLTLALICQEIIRYGWIFFTLMVVMIMATFIRVTRNWAWTPILIFNLICVLIGLCLRMYILIAPNV